MEKKPLSFSHYADSTACVCWYCHGKGERFARYLIPCADPSSRFFAPALLAEVCPDCEPRARKGERGNG